MAETHFFEQQDGSRIAYRVLESSEDAKNEVPLVMIVGVWCTKEDFMGWEEELAKHRKVILLDNRGMGESSIVSSDNISIDLMAQDTIALIKHLGIKRFNLLGWSIGGYIALCIALNVPSDLKLERVILCACSKQFKTSPFLVKLSEITESDVPKSVQEHKERIMQTHGNSCNDYLAEHPEYIDKLAETKNNTHRPLEILKRQWEAVERMDIASKLQTIQVPTLMLHGEADEIISVQEGELMAREIPNAKFVKLPNVGHRIWLTKPDPSAIINDFVHDVV